MFASSAYILGNPARLLLQDEAILAVYVTSLFKEVYITSYIFCFSDTLIPRYFLTLQIKPLLRLLSNTNFVFHKILYMQQTQVKFELYKTKIRF